MRRAQQKKAARETENCSTRETPQTDGTHGADSRTTSKCSESSRQSARASADGARGLGSRRPGHQEKESEDETQNYQRRESPQECEQSDNSERNQEKQAQEPDACEHKSGNRQHDGMNAHSGRAGSADAGLDLGGAYMGDD